MRVRCSAMGRFAQNESEMSESNESLGSRGCRTNRELALLRTTRDSTSSHFKHLNKPTVKLGSNVPEPQLKFLSRPGAPTHSGARVRFGAHARFPTGASEEEETHQANLLPRAGGQPRAGIIHSCQRLGLARLSRISRNSFGPLRSLRFRRCRSSSVTDGSIIRSISLPAISRALAAFLGCAATRWALGA